MAKLNDEQSKAFWDNEDRKAADDNLRKAIKNVQDISALSAQTILTCMTPALKKSDEAYNNLSIVEAQVEAEILGNNRTIEY